MSEELQKLPANATLPDIVRFEISTGQATPETAEKMLRLQIEWEANEAKKAFVEAKARLDFPAIVRTKKSLNSKYAPLELIQEITKPILHAEGFTLDFTSSEPNEKNWVKVTGKLSRGIHFEEAEIWQPVGSVSKAMNPNQAMASAISYAQRYLTAMMLNLRFVGMDDDAQTFSYITDQERMSIEDLMAECSADESIKSRFLEWAGAKTVGEITRDKYWGAIKYWEGRRSKIGQPK